MHELLKRTQTGLSCRSVEILVIADTLHIETLKALRAIPVTLPIVSFDNTTKVKASNRAFQYVTSYSGIAAIPDADNHTAPEFSSPRWITSQSNYPLTSFKLEIQALMQGNITLFNSAVLHNTQFPEAIHLGFLTLFAGLSLVLSPFIFFSSALWWALLSAHLFSLAIAVPLSFFNHRFWKFLLSLPYAFLIMLLLLFKLNGANQRFIHTDHGISEQDATQ